MVDADRDHREIVLRQQIVERLVRPPLTDVTGGGIENVLAIHEIDDRIAATLAVRVAARQVDTQRSLEAERGHHDGEGLEARGRGHRGFARRLGRGHGPRRERQKGGSQQRAHHSGSGKV